MCYYPMQNETQASQMTKHKSINTTWHTIQHWWRTYFLLRWVLANMLGWMLGLLLLSVMLWFFGWLGALFVGAGIGAGIGLPQAWVIFPADEAQNRRKWVFCSVVGGFFAVFPVVGLAIIGLFNLWIASALIGLAFGGIFGLLQSFVLQPMLNEDAYRWVLVSMLAGMIASVSMLITVYTPLPIIASPATLLYALITGWQLEKWRTAL